MIWWTGSQTAGTGYPCSLSDGQTIYIEPTHRCCIAITRRRGNQHVQHQYGRCCCGKTYQRTIHWGRRDESAWEASR